METIDWMSVIPVGIAIAILIGGMVMMFTGIWTSRGK
jgi:hypothetical protein